MLKHHFIALLFAAIPTCAMSTELNVVGTGDGIDMLSALAADYNAAQDGVLVSIPPSVGSGGGIAAIGSGAEPLARIARPLKEQEAEKGIKAVPIAKLPAAIYANKGVGVASISSEQLAGIFSGTIRNWKEVGGRDLQIKVVRREEADSTLTVLRGSMPKWKDLKLTERSKLAMTTQEAVDSVEAVEGAVGFGPYTTELGKRVAVLRIDELNPNDPTYPSAIVLAAAYIGTPRKDAAAFLDYLGSAAAKRIMTDFGAVPLP